MLFKIEKEITQEDLIYITNGLGYKEQIEKIEHLENMSMSDFENFKNQNPDRNLKISNVIDTNNCKIIEIKTCENPETREEFLSKIAMEKIDETIKNIMKMIEMQKLQEEIARKNKRIEKEIEKNVEKNPTNVIIE